MQTFSLFVNDPVYRLLAKLKLTTSDGLLKNSQTIILSILLTWVPVALLASYQGVALQEKCIQQLIGRNSFTVTSSAPSTPLQNECKTSFLLDFAAYAQFFFAIPFFIATESFIDDEIKFGIMHFVRSGIIKPIMLSKLKNTLETAHHTSSLSWPFFIMYLLGGHIGTWLWLSGELSNGVETWHAFLGVGGTEYLSLAGWWSGIVSVPIMVYWHIRWIWKISIWYWILWNISKMELQLNACHPDQFGGLGFLARLQSQFGVLIFAIGIVVASTIGYKLLIEEAPFAIVSVAGVIACYIFLAPAFFIAPLLLFRSRLSAAKKNDLLNYSELATKHTEKIETLLRRSVNDTAAVATKEINDAIQELSNLKNFYEGATKMYTLPFDFQHTKRLFASAVGPMIPILFQSPLVKSLISILLGTDR